MRNSDNFDFCERDRDTYDRDDFDFCEDTCDDVERRSYRTREFERRDFDFDEFDRRRRCDDDCDFDHRRRCDDDCDCDRRRRNDDDCDDKCKCHKDRECDCDEDRECRCRDRGFDGDCCESQVHCSDFRDFNEDERFGCNVRCDAAQSDDSWFECSEEECCTRCRSMCDEEKSFCKKLKCRIQVLDFALQETILFLDTHPCDFEALRYYRIIRRKLARLERIYECKCGPLTAQGVDTEFGWEWACCPWPWEGKD